MPDRQKLNVFVAAFTLFVCMCKISIRTIVSFDKWYLFLEAVHNKGWQILPIGQHWNHVLGLKFDFDFWPCVWLSLSPPTIIRCMTGNDRGGGDDDGQWPSTRLVVTVHCNLYSPLPGHRPTIWLTDWLSFELMQVVRWFGLSSISSIFFVVCTRSHFQVVVDI